MAFALVAKLALLLAALQLSGATHFFGDAVGLALAGELAHADEGCPDDGLCDDCPAGCPSCHCTSPLRALQAPSDLAVRPSNPSGEFALALPPTGVLSGPDRPGLYRPPRAPR